MGAQNVQICASNALIGMEPDTRPDRGRRAVIKGFFAPSACTAVPDQERTAAPETVYLYTGPFEVNAR